MAEVLGIEELRGRIDVIDEQLVRLLNVRVACAVEVGRLKHEAGLPVYIPSQALARTWEVPGGADISMCTMKGDRLHLAMQVRSL